MMPEGKVREKKMVVWVPNDFMFGVTYGNESTIQIIREYQSKYRWDSMTSTV